MSFRQASRQETNQVNTPTQIIEFIVPGYGPIHTFILDVFKFDISILVTLFAIIWLIYKPCLHFFENTYTTSFRIRNNDPLFLQLDQWLSSQPQDGRCRIFIADTDKELRESHGIKGETDITAHINFSHERIKRPRYTPGFGISTWVRYEGHLLRIVRVERSRLEAETWTEELIVSCPGRSPKPINQFLKHKVQDSYFRDQVGKTVVYGPHLGGFRPWATDAWDLVSAILVRQIDTVVMEEARKIDLLGDLNNYLQPEAGAWYATRGIQYRRGYLFFGPPGTGKTSFAFAAAGHFGLDIYLLSLGASNMTDEFLTQLFRNLPHRCIVLIEDIDSANIFRESAPSSGQDNAAGSSSQKSRLSLSVLLNAFDGVASQQGRILIMTTNHPERLDPALVRAARIDLKVSFPNATRSDCQDIFKNIYGQQVQDPDFARIFSDKISDGEFSQAAIQGFLILHKDDPEKACKEADVWVQEQRMRDGVIQAEEGTGWRLTRLVGTITVSGVLSFMVNSCYMEAIITLSVPLMFLVLMRRA